MVCLKQVLLEVAEQHSEEAALSRTSPCTVPAEGP